jgi:hypothetical protein
VGKHAVQRPRDLREIQRVDEPGRGLDLAALGGAEEAPKLLLDAPAAPRGLLLEGAERFQVTHGVDDLLDGGGPQCADQLVLQVGDADVEAEPFLIGAREVGAEAGSLEAAPEVALLAGVYDSEQDGFVTISKLGTGLSDEGWREIHKRLSSLEVAEKPARVSSMLVPDVWLQPAIVVEVLADEITPSPRHTAGFALRFPRIISFRTHDKKPEDATSVREIREMFEQQRQRQR